jgi:hypothetical protein
MEDVDATTAALGPQSRELAALKQEVRSLQMSLTQFAQQLESLPSLLDRRAIESEVDAVRSSQSALLRQQRAFVYKVTSRLQHLTSSTIAEIKSNKPLIKSSIGAPKQAEQPKSTKTQESPPPTKSAPPPEPPKKNSKAKPKGKVDSDDIILCEYPFNPNRPFDGIIAAITEQCGGNVEDKGLLQAVSSSCPT